MENYEKWRTLSDSWDIFYHLKNISININLCLIEIGFWDDSIYVKAQTYSDSDSRLWIRNFVLNQNPLIETDSRF